MTKIKLNLSYNMGNLTSTAPEASDDVLDLVASCFDDFSETSKVKTHLKNIQRHLISSISSEKRPQVFKMLNYLAGAFFAQHCNDEEIYNLCFSTLTQIKDQIDLEPQQNEELAELEWNELEKSVYLLSDWKDQMNGVVQEAVWKN